MNVELYVPPKKGSPDPVIGEIAALEKRIFPKHESMSSYLKEEVNRRGTSLLFVRAKQSPSNLEPVDALKVGANEPPPPVVGYIIFTASSLVGNITKLAVHEAYRQQGYASALIEAVVKRLKGRRIGSVALHVDPSRTAAFQLYKKLGFCVESEHESYYAPGRHAVRMLLEFG
eukprot:TRINITY_DN1737_c0_g1_i1.p1 TRINITY_DN1737_c0_g1~~TRINITY_DN1737_c0_g1_i1.p1  ORF type:complete len:173 (-),score=3.89 TRINITY_DN1737_c0_g1_i1:359-877(-)